ncbi:MAG: ABC transporter permease subunit [Rhizobiales bacterium]|nr:ABC transporter permease subunit [Hyphomicrobiales bacterium]
MRRSLAPLLYIAPLVVFFMGVMVYPFVDMVYQGCLPAIDILEAGNVDDVGARKTGLAACSLANYVSVFTDPFIRSTLLTSVAVSAIVSILSIALCIGPAWLLVRKDFWGKRMFRAILTIPMAFSGIIIGFLAVIMIGRIGFIPQLSSLLIGVPLGEALAYSLVGLGLAYIWFQIPRATLTLESAIRKFDWDLESAARGLGASNLQTLRYVLLPLLIPAMVSTVAVTFAVSMGSFGVALLLLKKASVFPLEIYNQVYANLAFEMAAAMSVVLGLLTVTINYFLRRWAERHYVFSGA